MKVFLLLAVLASVAISIHAKSTQGTCNPTKECATSTECALDADDLGCRCSFFKCKDFGDATCGGGCVTTGQCEQWGGQGCVCSWYFECETRSRMEEPGYAAYANLMGIIKKDKMAKRVAQLTREYKAFEEEVKKHTVDVE